MLWANGLPQHNSVDDECCPDFSCCFPGMYEEDSSRRRDYHSKLFTRLLSDEEKGRRVVRR